jgi:hypothetical protein
MSESEMQKESPRSFGSRTKTPGRPVSRNEGVVRKILARTPAERTVPIELAIQYARILDRIEWQLVRVHGKIEPGVVEREVGPPSVRYAERILELLAPRLTADRATLAAVSRVIDDARSTRPPTVGAVP